MRIYQIATVRLNRSLIRYYLMESGNIRQEYGVYVTCGNETAILPGITLVEAEARHLLEDMVRGKVTPVTARDIVEDWLCGR